MINNQNSKFQALAAPALTDVTEPLFERVAEILESARANVVRHIRLFYQTYPNRRPEIRHEVRDEFGTDN